MKRTAGIAPVVPLITVVCLAPAVVRLGAAQTTGVHELVFSVLDADGMRYALSLPADYDASRPRPLVLALHPGGGGAPYYGGSFMRHVVEPALRGWAPIIVAPDCPTRAWTSPAAERAVIALLESVMAEYAIDRTRILVTGFSLGGRGAWFFATRHADLFTGAIPMAGSPGDDPLDALGSMPVHIIHSVDDDVVPIGPARAAAEALEHRQHPVEFTELDGIGHFDMGGYVATLSMAGDWMQQRWREAGR